MSKSRIEYFVNKDKRTIVCKISGCEHITESRLDKLAPHFIYCSLWDMNNYEIPECFIGVAKCAPEDDWDEEYGKKLALTKAKQKRGKAINKTLNRVIKIMDNEMHNLMVNGIHPIPILPGDKQ